MLHAYPVAGGDELQRQRPEKYCLRKAKVSTSLLFCYCTYRVSPRVRVGYFFFFDCGADIAAHGETRLPHGLPKAGGIGGVYSVRGATGVYQKPGRRQVPQMTGGEPFIAGAPQETESYQLSCTLH